MDDDHGYDTKISKFNHIVLGIMFGLLAIPGVWGLCWMIVRVAQ